MRRHPWLVVSLLALVGVLVLGAFPTRAYLDQLQQRDELARRATELARHNHALAEEKARLESDETVERLARERYQLVRPGEEAYVILPDAQPGPAMAPEKTATPPASTAPPPRGPGWLSRVWAKLTSIF